VQQFFSILHAPLSETIHWRRFAFGGLFSKEGENSPNNHRHRTAYQVPHGLIRKATRDAFNNLFADRLRSLPAKIKQDQTNDD